MTSKDAQDALDKIIGQIFGYKNPLTLEQFQQKFAFDVRLPQQVSDATTSAPTWAGSVNPTRFITMDNARKRAEVDDWILPSKSLNSVQDILTAWNEVNLTATERQIDSINFSESDMVYSCENVYRSQDVHRSKNLLFCDAIMDCEHVAASQRSNSSTFCARLEDSKESSNSFSVSWSAKAINSFFVHDCYDVFECMFCSHIAAKQFCIANMQYEEAEYRQLKDQVIRWILTG